MRDTWLGSGILSYERTFSLQCPACDFEFEEDFTVDDYGVVEEAVYCLKCKHYFEYFEEVGRGKSS